MGRRPLDITVYTRANRIKFEIKMKYSSVNCSCVGKLCPMIKMGKHGLNLEGIVCKMGELVNRTKH